jgi:hypothetical protein
LRPDTRPRRLLRTLALAGLLQAVASCGSSPDPVASARTVVTRAEVPEGARALGDVGDFLLENDRVRVVIQGPGYSRGFGVYGGSLIDAARVDRRQQTGDSSGGVGADQFGELFPSFFLQAVAVDKVEVVASGSDGKAAAVRASGTAGDFLELVGYLNRAITGSNENTSNAASPARIAYATTYELEPGANWLRLRFRVENISTETLKFPGAEAAGLLSVIGLETDGFTVPLGDIALFGATSKLFVPGAGFDLRSSLDRSYDAGIDWPAFPGVVTDWVASRGDGVSYGMMIEPSQENFVLAKADTYAPVAPFGVTDRSMLIPFVTGGFTGLFHRQAPTELAPAASFEVIKYFVIGDGDVGSVVDSMLKIQGAQTGRVAGRVLDEITREPLEEASVIVRRQAGDRFLPFSQYDVRDGSFAGNLPPGRYEAVVVGEGRPNSPPTTFEVVEGAAAALDLSAPDGGRVVVRFVDDKGLVIPAKATAVGTYDAANANRDPRTFLYDASTGEHSRVTDLVVDSDDPDTRRFVEDVAWTEGEQAELHMRPGTYQVFGSRGIEYGTQTREVTVAAGQTVSLTMVLPRVLDTAGWLSADMHIHSINSIDAAMPLDRRVRSLAAEGVEIAISTDHNFITDFGPTIDALDLRRFMTSFVGLELTTLEAGHFNGYPLKYQPGPVGKGAFGWSQKPPAELWAELRALGAEGSGNTIVQVNHARDSILGYFSQFNRNGLSAQANRPGVFDRFTSPTGPAFIDQDGKSTYSEDFEALEIVNGKLFNEIRHFRTPAALPPGPVPADVPATGAIVMDDNDVAFPGVVDDWFNLLNLGKRYIGVGTSDTHSGDDEAGYFRTMGRFGTDDPRDIRPLDFVNGLRSREIVATNGPMLTMSVDGGRLGQTLTGKSGPVTVSLRLAAAPWVGVAHVNLIRNGQILQRFEIPAGTDLTVQPWVQELTVEPPTSADGTPLDQWFVAEAIGDTSLFPIVTPVGVPPLLITDAVASLAAPLGLGSDEYGVLQPSLSFPVTAYAITNPIWVARGETFEAPGIVPAARLKSADNDPKWPSPPLVETWADRWSNEAIDKRRATPRLIMPMQSLFARDPDHPADVRRIFAAFNGHGGHGH